MAASRTALPSVVPMTVVSAARVPSRAPVAMTSVTIGPGVSTITAVINRKAANSSQFMIWRFRQSLSRTCSGMDFRLGVENASNVMTLPAVLLAFLADALDRDHALAFGGVEHDHALGRAPRDADALDARADELAA